MTLVPMKKRCAKCGRHYIWNPDVGQGLFCPHCEKKSIVNILKRIFEGK